MHTLRVFLICLGFAASDMCLPVGASAFEVVEEGEEVGHHRTRRGSLRHAALPHRVPPAVGHVPVIRVPKPSMLGSDARAAIPRWRPARKVPAATSEPAPALDDQS